MALHSRVLFDSLLLDLAPYLSPEDKGRVLRLKFGERLPIPPGTSGRSYAAYALLNSAFKKFEDEVDLEATAVPAYVAFIIANNACGSWDNSNTSSLGPYDETLLGEFRWAMSRYFTISGGFDLLSSDAIMAKVDFGPGSSAGCAHNDFATKVGASKLNASNPYLIKLFEAWVSHHPARVDCELARYLSYGAPEVNRAVPLTAVPKTTEIARLVKTEPPLNMFFQKGIQAVMEERLVRHFGLDLSTQPLKNAELARIGSLDGSYGTIDLKQASDYLSLALIREFVPGSNLSWFMRTRSDLVTLPWFGREITIPLEMAATMGNAWCFPLQTVVFACVVEAAYRTIGLPFDQKSQTWVCYDRQTHTWETQVEPGTWGVNGDDIVVRREAYDTVIRLLKHLGFVPNLDKSFNDGQFRESCGSDWLNGVNVRGVYISTLKTPQSRAVAFNRLSAWSSRTGVKIPYTLMAARPRREDRCPVVPVWENDDAGVKLPLSCAPGVQILVDRDPAVGPRCELPVDGPLPYRLGTVIGVRAWQNVPGSLLYRAWRPVASGYNVLANERERFRGDSNPFALYLALLHGHVRNGFIAQKIRAEAVAYRVTKQVAPGWDYMPSWKAREYGSLEAWKGLLEPLFGWMAK